MLTKAKSSNPADLRDYLEAERRRLQREIRSRDLPQEASTDESRVGIANHMADDATEVYEQERNVGIKRDQELLLAEVEAALERMDRGTYGICERCGRRIEPARLRAMPTARFCLEDQEAAERK